MDSGNPVVIEGGQSWLATSDTYTPSAEFDTSEALAGTNAFADVDALQAAILAGEDPHRGWPKQPLPAHLLRGLMVATRGPISLPWSGPPKRWIPPPVMTPSASPTPWKPRKAKRGDFDSAPTAGLTVAYLDEDDLGSEVYATGFFDVIDAFESDTGCSPAPGQYRQ